MTRHFVRAFVGLALLAGAVFAASQSTSAATLNVQVGDIFFCNASFQGGVCERTINAGDTVTWDFSGAGMTHTTTACGADCDNPTNNPLWDSGFINDGSTFSYTFNQPGTYRYYCKVHPFIQRGVIIVQGAGGSVGDVNCSSAVDSIDAALVLQYNAGLVNSLSCQQNADVNSSGAVDSIDAALILQYTAGLLPSLPP